jgi:hypothetical protein
VSFADLCIGGWGEGGDKETRGQGDKGTRGWGDKRDLYF